MLESTSKFRVHDIVYKTGSFAVARGFWEGSTTLSVACRWYEDGGLGYPQTFGKPQWMMFPDSVRLDIIGAQRGHLGKVVLTFPEPDDAPAGNVPATG